MSERVKHRIVGALVLSSLMIIFLPAILKKSNHNFEKNIKLALKLPNKPSLPKVNAPNDKEIFKSVSVVQPQKIKVAKVDKNLLIAKAEPLEVKHLPIAGSNISSINSTKFNKDKNYIKLASNIPKPPSSVKTESLNLKKASVVALNPISTNKDKNVIKVSNPSQGKFFSIQVATFTQKSNADLLIDKLKNKGFIAAANAIKKENGNVLYQVVVGKVSQRDEAIDLQKKLASTMQLNGFIVKSEVS